MSGTFWSDVSYFQKRLDLSLTDPFIFWRIADGSFIDPNATHNRDVSRQLIANGTMVGHGGYYVPRPNQMTTDAAIQVIQSVVGAPDLYWAWMQDVENWGGSIGGDHSQYYNDLHNKVCNWLTSRKRAIGYANHGDYYSLWRNPPADLRMIGAGYGINPNLPNQIGWQYSDGAPQYGVPAGWRRSVAPFGPCDQNHSDLNPADFAAALGLGQPAAVPLSVEEEVMAFYKSREEFEAALTAASSNGVWGVGKSAQWWLWRMILTIGGRRENVAFSRKLLDQYNVVNGTKVLDAATSAANHKALDHLFSGQADDTLLNQVLAKLSTGGQPVVQLYTRPKSGARMFQPVNDGAERRWVSVSQAKSWPQGYVTTPLPDTDPFWDVPSLTASAEAQADSVEALDKSQNPGA